MFGYGVFWVIVRIPFFIYIGYFGFFFFFFCFINNFLSTRQTNFPTLNTRLIDQHIPCRISSKRMEKEGGRNEGMKPGRKGTASARMSFPATIRRSLLLLSLLVCSHVRRRGPGNQQRWSNLKETSQSNFRICVCFFSFLFLILI
ncbi:hypothetical protein I7I50_11602 [Histoplasma capsulatum G186AR]|uniref:Uncharacterized protein n=1 Tax=Ajellomyces capsulatus TaxID=5037 RepID=A0A8H8D756_AJECA|nr:hypothetical protein I7I52_02839 [Histoplasma capsulatum]QSS70088.1 hypothetical protein I7I50_11602 [Histoplasma capsulatum G186AR]